VILTGGGGAPIDFFSAAAAAAAAAAALINCRRSAAWHSRVKHVGLGFPFSSFHVSHEYNENRQTSRMQHLSPSIKQSGLL